MYTIESEIIYCYMHKKGQKLFVVRVKVVIQGSIICTINGIQASVKNARSKGPEQVFLNKGVNFDVFALERYLLGNASYSIRC